jgi:hypothetical protein
VPRPCLDSWRARRVAAAVGLGHRAGSPVGSCHGRQQRRRGRPADALPRRARSLALSARGWRGGACRHQTGRFGTTNLAVPAGIPAGNRLHMCRLWRVPRDRRVLRAQVRQVPASVQLRSQLLGGPVPGGQVRTYLYYTQAQAKPQPAGQAHAAHDRGLCRTSPVDHPLHAPHVARQQVAGKPAQTAAAAAPHALKATRGLNLHPSKSGSPYNSAHCESWRRGTESAPGTRS